MSRFYGSLNGGRGESTRTGTKNSGLRAHARGWHIGGKVEVFQGVGDTDTVRLYITGGSNGHFSDVLIGTWQLVDGKPVKVG